MRYVFACALVALAALSAGCASNMTAKKRVSGPLPIGARVAVLPFENLSGAENAGEIVTANFQTLLSGVDRLALAESGEVFEGLRRYRIRSATRISRAEIDSLAALLQLDFLLIGSVVEYDERDDRFLGTVPIVSYNCRLIDCRTGATAWVATANGRGDKGEIVFGIGAIRSADDLALTLTRETTKEISGLFRSK